MQRSELSDRYFKSSEPFRTKGEQSTSKRQKQPSGFFQKGLQHSHKTLVRKRPDPWDVPLSQGGQRPSTLTFVFRTNKALKHVRCD
jgi:hypothetical protein